MPTPVSRARQGRAPHLTLLSVLALLAGLPVAHAAAAQEPVAPGPTELDGVVVTAQRRETKLESTPVAATVFDARAIETNRIQNIQDVAIRTPGVTFTQFSNQESYIAIRGTLINNNAAGWDDSITTFIDEVPTTGLGDANPDLFDLKSIEVLRGPQGTLFGRNSSGGAVVITTLSPSFTPGGKVELTYGADNLAEARGYYTGPLSPTLAGKISGDVTHRDGYIRNVTRGDDTSGVDRVDVRTQLLWHPRGTFDAILSLDYLVDRSGGYPTRLLGQFVPALYPTLRFGPDVTNQAINGYQHRDVGGASLRAHWTIGAGELTSVSAYRYVRGRFPNTVIGDPQNALPTVGTLLDNQFTQEVRFQSPAVDRFSYVVGVFGLHADKKQGASLGFRFNPLTVAGLFATNNYQQFSGQRVAVDNIAVFGEATYAFSKAWRLALGARESYEHKSGDASIRFDSANPALAPGAATFGDGWNSFAPRANLSFQPFSSLLLYGTVSKGFKSGGYDLSGSGGRTSADVSAALRTSFAPETVWNYEAGEKVTFLGGRAVINADVFDQEYSNLQTPQLIQINNRPVQVTTSSGDARVSGLELESTAFVTRGLQVGMSYAYTDAHFTSNGTGYTGKRVPYVPKNALHFFTEYSHALPSGGVLSIGADDTIRTKIFFDTANSAPAFVRSQTRWNSIVNAHLDYVAPSGWKLSAWAKNLTNEQPVLHGSDVTVLYENLAELQRNPGGIFLAKFFEQRVFGVSLTVPLH